MALAATLRAIRNEEFRCEKCLARWKDDEDGRKRSEHFRRHRMGCFARGEKVFWRWGRIEFKTCVGNLTTAEAVTWMTMWHAYQEKGTLPFAGGLGDQPAKIMEAFDVLASLDELRKTEERRAEAPKTQEDAVV